MIFPKRRIYRVSGGGGTKHKASGLVVANGKGVRDDNGAFFPLGTSLFWAWWGWKHDQARTKQNAEEVAGWIDYARLFGEVGGASWEDRTIDPRESDYEDIGKACTDDLFGRLGIRTQLTIFAGGSGASTSQTMQKVKNIIRGRQEAFISAEISNEGKLSKEEMRALAQELQSAFPGLLVATTSPGAGPWDASSFDLDICGLGTDHPERQPGDEDWRQVRQGCEIMGLPKVKDDNEPPGFESSIAVLGDPLRLACLRIVGILSGMVCYVHHTGAGIRGGGAADLARGRKSNLWEYDGLDGRDDLAAAARAYRLVEGSIPAEAPNWRGVKGHWSDTRLFADMVWSDNPAAFDHGCVRVYGSYTDNAYAEIVFGVRRYVMLTQKAGGYNVQAIDIGSGATVLQRPLADGETFRLEGDPTGGSNSAALIIGTR